MNPWHSKNSWGDDGYDVMQKYCLMWDVMVNSMNAIVETAGSDLTIDETTWANGGYTDVHVQIIGKPNVTKGGQHVICADWHNRLTMNILLVASSSPTQLVLLHMIKPKIIACFMTLSPQSKQTFKTH